MGSRNQYAIRVSHKHLSKLNGTFDAVVEERINWGVNEGRTVTCWPFGCSRPYKVDSDEAAIKLLLREHLATLESCEQTVLK